MTRKVACGSLSPTWIVMPSPWSRRSRRVRRRCAPGGHAASGLRRRGCRVQPRLDARSLAAQPGHVQGIGPAASFGRSLILTKADDPCRPAAASSAGSRRTTFRALDEDVLDHRPRRACSTRRSAGSASPSSGSTSRIDERALRAPSFGRHGHARLEALEPRRRRPSDAGLEPEPGLALAGMQMSLQTPYSSLRTSVTGLCGSTGWTGPAQDLADIADRIAVAVLEALRRRPAHLEPAEVLRAAPVEDRRHPGFARAAPIGLEARSSAISTPTRCLPEARRARDQPQRGMRPFDHGETAASCAEAGAPQRKRGDGEQRQ